jgi:hypothetical protein
MTSTVSSLNSGSPHDGYSPRPGQFPQRLNATSTLRPDRAQSGQKLEPRRTGSIFEHHLKAAGGQPRLSF